MSTTQNPVVAAAAPVKKVSFLKHVGNFLAKVGTVFLKDAVPAEPMIAAALERLFPKFAPAIETADGLFTKIAKQLFVTETKGAAVATAPTGEAKLQAVTDLVGSEMDQWIKNLFPGAVQIDAAEKSGLVQAVFNIINKQPPSALLPPAN